MREPKKENYTGFRASRMSIIGTDAQRKNPFGDKKIVSNFWQKPSSVSSKKRDALIKKANDLLGQLANVEDVADKSINATLNKMKNHSRGMRADQQYEAKEIYRNITRDIELTKSKIYGILQNNNLSLHHKASSQKTELSQKQYAEILKHFDNVERDFKSSLEVAKIRLGEINKA
ncbi:hypothetical protein KPG66_01855 [Mycetohabitans sp. B2]|uniref:hypothetical protein n=1 Tax=Mycetohabitans sp. B2 TaxID=2841274 RepID=UPI001F424005|nr:hypothetical protein [Mycetohabitans sp. B2]MCF7694910.1 hypothetical protein [Mycetohabitans sp. B2]